MPSRVALLSEAIRAKITDAYYDARNAGETMETAADNARDAVVALVVEAEAQAYKHGTDDGFNQGFPDGSREGYAEALAEASTQITALRMPWYVLLQQRGWETAIGLAVAVLTRLGGVEKEAP